MTKIGEHYQIMRQKRIAHIIGLGRSGKAAALLLMSEGWRIIITDDNDNVKLRETAQVLRRMGCEVFLGSHTKALE